MTNLSDNVLYNMRSTNQISNINSQKFQTINLNYYVLSAYLILSSTSVGVAAEAPLQILEISIEYAFFFGHGQEVMKFDITRNYR